MTAKAVMVGGISLLRSFSSLSLHKVVVTRYANDAARYSRDTDEHVVISNPVTNPEKVVSELVEIAKDLAEKPVLYYGDDVMLLVISRNREILGKYYHFLMPDKDIIEGCSDKQLFSELAIKYKLPVPATIDAEKITDCNNPDNLVSFPVVVKPLLSTGKIDVARLSNGIPQKVFIVNTCDELKDVLQKLGEKKKDFAVQEYIPGGEEEIYSFHTYADENYRPVACYVGKKIRTYPAVGGISTYIELINNPEIVRLGTKIITALKVKGPVKIDFKRDINRDEYYLLELNLRFNLWNYLGAAYGINLAEIAYMHSCGIPYTINKTYKTGLRWLSFGDDFRSFWQCYRPAGALTISSWARSLMAPKVYHIFSWRDPLPFIVKITYSWLRMLKRTLLNKP